MYAVYGLDESKEHIEEFLGYVPASFFNAFHDPQYWTIKMVTLPDGHEKVGRLAGRALFVSANNLRADERSVRKYMGENAWGSRSEDSAFPAL